MVHENPLIGNSGLPHFDKIRPEHVRPAVDHVLQRCESLLQKLESDPQPEWNKLLVPLETIRRELHNTWSPIQHLIGVKNSPELREAYEASLPQIVSFSLRLSQSRAVYVGLKNMKEQPSFPSLSEAQKRIVEHLLLNAKLSGIELEGAAQERFNEISQKLSQLQTTYSNNVLDATKDFELIVKDKKDLAGIPANFLGMWAENYQTSRPGEKASAEAGPWRVTLDFPSYIPFLKYGDSRPLREKLYRAYISRASSGKFDNTKNIYDILRLRRELARLLGYKTYAEVSLAMKMAGAVNSVDRLLEDLAKVSTHKAHEELQELRAFAQTLGLKGDLQNWDIYYYLEKMRQKKFDFTDDELRPYFPLPRVLNGLFELLHTLFGIKVVARTDNFPRWHPDVSFYDVFDDRNQKIAGFYLDPYSRPAEKRGGAWMDSCLDRGQQDGQSVLPVAYLVCNGTPPVGNTPSLLSFDEVETLFHEFGHGLQHMLTRVDELEVAGINGIEWDAVELPSQFMENWCYQKSVIKNLTKHIQTGESLPDDLFRKIYEARTFNAANLMVRQLHFAMNDMELHHRFDPDGKVPVEEVSRRIAQKVCAIQPIPEDRSLCTFEHIFAGSYAAGYYSYKWAEVLSADAFSRFEEEGLDETTIARVGRDFRETVLALGGSQHPMDVFTRFRGRPPRPDALLKHNGLTGS
ncbi:M3 family metallopeptidase [Oligoflexus tunisiensis]|uniref:M3 family metallopeptidase n=1 Tax=Oligoflexus tunisiensis TaxID=708132 RepID=UPI000A6FD6D2